MHAWEKLHTFSGKGSFIGWLLKVAYTTFLQSKRKSKRYAEILEAAGKQADVMEQAHARQSEEIGDLDRFLAVLTDAIARRHRT